MLRALIACLLGLVLLATPAQAGWRIDRATEIAAKVWHHPCVDRLRISWADPRDYSASEDAEAIGAWSYEDDEDCIVYFNQAETLEWEQFCTFLLHEAGHLAHFRDASNTAEPWHSANPSSVMRATIGFDHVVDHGKRRIVGGDRRCRDRGRPYLGLTRTRQPRPAAAGSSR